MLIQKIDVARGVFWVEIAECDLRLLCGCPADAVKHLIKRGLILQREVKGVAAESGPNAILLSDLAVQNGEFSNLAEFPVLQMLYKQGMLLPGHPNNTGRKPLLIGAPDQVAAQLRYIYRGNYGLISREELLAAGVEPERASAQMRLKLAFAFGKIRSTRDFVDSCQLDGVPVEIAPGVHLSRLRTNVFELRYRDESVTLDLNLDPGETYECPYPLGFRRFEPDYFSVLHAGEGDGWDINRPGMGSVINFQGRTYLIDAGPQLQHILTALGLSVDQIDGFFHTHAHDDHFAGLSALMHAGKRIRYYATAPVRASVAKKLTALLGIEEERFADFFDIHDLPCDTWSDIEGLEVKPLFSPHPVETNIFIFRTLWENGYRSYGHFADIVSLDVLRGMITADARAPGLDSAAFEQVREDYHTPVNVKKIDIGGGLIHGAAADFRDDRSQRILLAHRATPLTAAEKEIGSSAAFGTSDVLVAGQSDGFRRHAFAYLQAHLPGVPLHQLRMLVNHPVDEVNPGAILLKENEMPAHVLLLLSGRVERLCTRDKLHGYLSAGALIGDAALFEQRPAQRTYRAESFLRVMRLPPSLYAEVVERNGLREHRRQAAQLNFFLDSTRLFGDGLPPDVLSTIVETANECRYPAGAEIRYGEGNTLNLIRSGRVVRSIGHRVVDVLEARDCFGEEGAVLGTPFRFRLRALDDTIVIRIPGQLLTNVPILRWKLLETYQHLNQRLQQQTENEESEHHLHWRDDYLLQLERMDRHHQRLVGIANAIIDSLGSEPGEQRQIELTNVCDALEDCARHHLEAEEELMRLYAYPGADAHCEQHATLLAELLAYRPLLLGPQPPTPQDFHDFFENWLIRHINTEDRHYGAYLNERGVY